MKQFDTWFTNSNFINNVDKVLFHFNKTRNLVKPKTVLKNGAITSTHPK